VKIRKTDVICGYPALLIRDLFKKLLQTEWLPGAIEQILGLEIAEATCLIEALLRDSYIEPSRIDGHYHLTTKGYALANATAARPIRRETAERVLEEFLARVEAVNRDPELLYSIGEVWVFGSYLGEGDELGDVDVAATFVRREPDPGRFEELRRRRVEQAKKAGRTFPTFLDELYWGRHEVELLLKSGQRSLNLHDLEDHRPLIEDQPHRVLYANGRRVER
jgi:predicted nucleotidyltransferase